MGNESLVAHRGRTTSSCLRVGGQTCGRFRGPESLGVPQDCHLRRARRGGGRRAHGLQWKPPACPKPHQPRPQRGRGDQRARRDPGLLGQPVPGRHHPPARRLVLRRLHARQDLHARRRPRAPPRVPGGIVGPEEDLFDGVAIDPSVVTMPAGQTVILLHPWSPGLADHPESGRDVHRSFADRPGRGVDSLRVGDRVFVAYAGPSHRCPLSRSRPPSRF